MLRTRCPTCATVFRVTPEQLGARGGKVRCGHCQSVFNALTALLDEIPPVPAPNLTLVSPPPPAEVQPPPEPLESVAPVTAETASEIPVEVEETLPAPEVPAEPEPITAEMPAEPETPEEETALAAEPALAPLPETELAESEPAFSPADETPEQTTAAAREAGLVAARELTEVAGYNRWAAGTLAGNPLAGLETEPPARVTWPFTLVSLLLILALLGQVTFYFRTEITQRLPSLRGAYEALEIDIPLPADAALVSIEASNLESDNSRSLFVLQATLKNRATYAQAWPALELTLTDVQDTVVARRVLRAPDYLPPGIDPTAFPANNETAVRLWIEAKDLAAAGYRLYVFYP